MYFLKSLLFIFSAAALIIVESVKVLKTITFLRAIFLDIEEAGWVFIGNTRLKGYDFFFNNL